MSAEIIELHKKRKAIDMDIKHVVDMVFPGNAEEINGKYLLENIRSELSKFIMGADWEALKAINSGDHLRAENFLCIKATTMHCLEIINKIARGD